MKKIAVIQDLSSFGKCSLTAAIPVLSVMGVQACPLPTAILSAQTEFPSFFYKDLTDKIPIFEHEWNKLQVEFNGIHTGYITGKEQLLHILQFLTSFHNKDTLLLVDPVMGDIGESYTNFNDDLLEQMKILTTKADIVTPNLTECCLLTGQSYEEINSYTNRQDFLQAIQEAGRQLQRETNAHIIITGIHSSSIPSLSNVIGNMSIDHESTVYTEVPYNGKSYSGTGDLFASVLMGSLMRGEDLPTAIQLAETFITNAIADTDIAGTPGIEGIQFEKHLKLLL